MTSYSTINERIVIMDFWQILGVNVASSLVVSLVTATCVFLFQKKYYSKLNFSNKLHTIGFSEALNSSISQYEWKKLFQNNDVIKIMYVSGNYLMKHIKPFIDDALQRGVEIQFLCADPNSTFAQDVEKIEIKGGQREEGTPVSNEIQEILKLYKESGLKIKFYSTEYRMPLVIGENKEKDTLQFFLTITLPPYKSKRNIILRGKASMKDMVEQNESKAFFPEMMLMHFDTVWNLSRDAFPKSKENTSA